MPKSQERGRQLWSRQGHCSRFKNQNAALVEQILWDWCPFLRILVSYRVSECMACVVADPHARCDVGPFDIHLPHSIQQRLQHFPLANLPHVWLDRGPSTAAMPRHFHRALSAVVAHGAYWFTSLRRQAAETLHSDIADVRDGGGANIVHFVMQWVKTVQLRAFQDHSASQAKDFERASCITECALWSEYFKGWAEMLALRDDRDIGWVASTNTRVWKHSAGIMREDIQPRVCDLGRCMAEEDDICWQEHFDDSVEGSNEATHTRVVGFMKEERLHRDFGVQGIAGENFLSIATSGIGDHAHTTPAREEYAYPLRTKQADEIHTHGYCTCIQTLLVTQTKKDVDNSKPLVSTGATNTGLGVSRNDNNKMNLLHPPTVGLKTTDDPYTFHSEASHAVQCPSPAVLSTAEPPL